MPKDKEEKKEKKEKKYDAERQPLWITDKSFDKVLQLNGKGREGQRIYLYEDKEFAVIANKDWEQDGELRPGKAVKLEFSAMDALCVSYLKEMYGYDLELKDNEDASEKDDDEEDDE